MAASQSYSASTIDPVMESLGVNVLNTRQKGILIARDYKLRLAFVKNLRKCWFTLAIKDHQVY